MRKAWLAATAVTTALMMSGCVIVVDGDDDDGTKMLRQHRSADGYRVLDTDDDYSRLAGDLKLRGRIGGDLSLVAGDVDMDGLEIGGEMSIAAGDVNFSGTVNGEASIAGGDVNWSGTGRDEVNIAAGDLNVSGRIEGEASMASGDMDLDAWFGNGLNAQAGAISLTGEVHGRLKLISAEDLDRNRNDDHGQIEISGTIADGGEICARRLEIASSARISGTLVVWTETRPEVDPGAEVENLVYTPREGRDCDDLVEDWD